MIEVGQVYPAQLKVTDATGAPASPSAATLTATLPDQTSQTVTVPLPSAVAGTLLAPFTITQAGLHRLVWQTTSPNVVKTDYFSARQYVSAISLDSARDRLGLQSTARDEQVRDLCAVATREVEKVVGVLVPRVYTDDWCPGTYRDVIRVPHGPLLSAASVISLRSAFPQGPSWVLSQLVVNVRPGTVRLAGLLPFWYGPWLMTYTAGVQEVAEPIEEGIREVVFDLWNQYRGLTADYAESNEQESVTVPPGYRLPPRALTAIKGYELPGFG